MTMSGSTPTTAAEAGAAGNTDATLPPAAPDTDPAQPVVPDTPASQGANLERVLAQLSAWLPPLAPPTDWSRYRAWRWVQRGGRGVLVPLAHTHAMDLTDLHGIDVQRERFDRNIRQFIAGLPANHVLLSGARGCGKSSLVKAALHTYADRKLRVVEVDVGGLQDLPDIVELLRGRPERFLLFCDDLSFDGGDLGWTALKSLLDGSLSAQADNVLMVATSNRRHLMADLHSDNQDTQHVGDEVHPGEAVEEKISLSDRFGLWLSFYPMDQQTYLAVARHWVSVLGVDPGASNAHFEREALQWSLARSSRSGRSAWQFARDWVGRSGLGD